MCANATDRQSGNEQTTIDAILETDDGRPDDCDCWDPDAELPCWPCYRDGFRTQNPDVEVSD